MEIKIMWIVTLVGYSVIGIILVMWMNKSNVKRRKSMIELGDVVEDTITSFKGTATGKVIYLNGCIQFLVEPKGLNDGQLIKGEWIDQGQLEIIKRNKRPKTGDEPGGPHFSPLGLNHPK